jgi:excisionase family DNA binding protein
MNEIFSTREMARLCGVNESTIKRWADSGRLPCIKTPGGHRKFRIRDALNFLNEYGFEGLGVGPEADGNEGETSLTVRVLRRDWDGLARGYLQAAIDGPAHEAVRYLFRCVSGGVTLVEICDRILSPALEALGENWRSGKTTILEEHLASATTIHVLERLGDTVPHLDPVGLKALTAPVEGETHEIGARMAALVLETLGWEVRLATTSTPTAEIAEYVRRERPALLCLSAVCVRVDDAFRDRHRIIWQAARDAGTRLAIGGRSVHGLADLPADLLSSDLESLDRLARTMTGRRGVHHA